MSDEEPSKHHRSVWPFRELGPRVSGALAGAVAGVLAAALAGVLGAHAEHDHTSAQVALAVFGVGVVGAWAALEARRLATAETEEEAVDLLEKQQQQQQQNEDMFDDEANALQALRAGAEFAAILAVIYACDRTTLARAGPKFRDAKAFWGVWCAVCAAALVTVRRNKAVVLSRDQTEEWKGWMQIMFLLYHYFNQAELYNAIRVYIAAYVWMTGYGNFLYYQKTGNFGLVRVAQTLFRLNFFVFFVCVLLRNEYMLYYICPMHTVFTLFVWLALRFGQSFLAFKLAATFALTYVLYDTSFFQIAFGWQPLRWLLAFHDPLHPEFSSDELHEWQFRSGLDRYVWIFGAACAAALPALQTLLEAVDRNERFFLRTALRFVLTAACAGAVAVWAVRVYALDKFAYNTLHPYTSWLPILAYVVLRNLLPLGRAFSLRLFGFLGKITLETYILQFHVWMHSTGLNGSPKSLLVLLPDHFWLNFLLVSGIYLFLSLRVFDLTTRLKDTLLPTDALVLARRTLKTAVLLFAFFVLVDSLWTSSLLLPRRSPPTTGDPELASPP